MEELPDPVADLQEFLREKEERDRLETEAQAAEQESAMRTAATDASWGKTEDDVVAEELLEVIGGIVDEKPQDTVSVLRVWLAEDQLEEARGQDGETS